jgi:D-serine dehydratase
MTHNTEEQLGSVISDRDKGVPALPRPISLSEVRAQNWSVLREDVPLPIAILRESALRHNSSWMTSFLSRSGALIAPHGKTTMSPGIFDRQITDGAWGITLSTPHQVQVARSFGYNRIFYANQLVGRAAICYVLRELKAHPDFEFLCLVDSIVNARTLAEAAHELGLTKPLKLLVEVGYEGGRTGCRTLGEAIGLAEFVAENPLLELSGVEGFEGLLRGETREHTTQLVEAFLSQVTRVVERCDSLGLFDGPSVILSAGGSAFYDLVIEAFSAVRIGRPVTVILRAGCYITHDSVLLKRAFEALQDRSSAAAALGEGLQHALEVWAYVQSRPEPQKVIIALGKRDVSYDEFPVPLLWFRPSGAEVHPSSVPAGHEVIGLNDQHCHMSVPADSPLAVGDMVGFGISHPCLTFDKWRVIHFVDDDYGITSSIRTYF